MQLLEKLGFSLEKRLLGRVREFFLTHNLTTKMAETLGKII